MFEGCHIESANAIDWASVVSLGRLACMRQRAQEPPSVMYQSALSVGRRLQQAIRAGSATTLQRGHTHTIITFPSLISYLLIGSREL